MNNAKLKIEEARYFLNLLHYIEEEGKSITTSHSVEDEVTFLFSAILNAFYSVTEYIYNAGKSKEVKEFRDSYPHIYNHSHKGGYRSIATHKAPVPPDFRGYKPPKADRVNFHFRGKLAFEERRKPTPGHVNIRFGGGQHYMDVNGEWYSLVDLCATHIRLLIEFERSLNS